MAARPAEVAVLAQEAGSHTDLPGHRLLVDILRHRLHHRQTLAVAPASGCTAAEASDRRRAGEVEMRPRCPVPRVAAPRATAAWQAAFEAARSAYKSLMGCPEQLSASI